MMAVVLLAGPPPASFIAPLDLVDFLVIVATAGMMPGRAQVRLSHRRRPANDYPPPESRFALLFCQANCRTRDLTNCHRYCSLWPVGGAVCHL